VVEQLVGFRPKDDLKTVLDAHQAVPGQAAAAS
jgi:hypothetical protein